MNRYTAAHETPNGSGDARPTAEQVIKDEGLENKLSGKRVLITGGTAGLGKETARVLQKNGAKVFITARTAEKGEEVAKSLNDENSSSPPVEVVALDLSSLQSVREAAKDFQSRSETLNVLVNNAGVMACPEGQTQDGFETQFGVNHLAHFLLFQLLKSTLLASSTSDFNSRVVVLSSSAHRYNDIHFDNYSLAGEYDPWAAYAQAKTANILFANELDRRYGSHGLHGLSLHPGVIMDTELSRHQIGAQNEHMEQMMANPRLKQVTKSPAQGAATQVWAAVGKELEGKGGLFLDNVGVGSEVPADTQMFESGFRPHIWNKGNGVRLWEDSLKLVNLA